MHLDLFIIFYSHNFSNLHNLTTYTWHHSANQNEEPIRKLNDIIQLHSRQVLLELNLSHFYIDEMPRTFLCNLYIEMQLHFSNFNFSIQKMYIFLAFSIIAIFPENRPFDLKQIENWIEFYPIKCPTINIKNGQFYRFSIWRVIGDWRLNSEVVCVTLIGTNGFASNAIPWTGELIFCTV